LTLSRAPQESPEGSDHARKSHPTDRRYGWRHGIQYLRPPAPAPPKPSSVALQSLPEPASTPAPFKEVGAAITVLDPIPLPKPRPNVRPAPPKAEVLLTAAAIAAILVRASRQAYYASGRPCACPDDAMRNGRRCGERSAYSRPGGAQPLCYVSDVTPPMIKPTGHARPGREEGEASQPKPDNPPQRYKRQRPGVAFRTSDLSMGCHPKEVTGNGGTFPAGSATSAGP
jgi:hypothetical protein